MKELYSPPEAHEKGVVLLSGGMDSTALLAYLQNGVGAECWPLTINYGQRHIKERDAATRVCEELGIAARWSYLDLSPLKAFIHSALTGAGDIPSGHYSDEIQKATVSPNRNMILLAIAAGYAHTINATFVAYAAHSNDRAIYPDCRPEFIESAAETIRLGTDGNVRLIEPVAHLHKTDLVTLGLNNRAPFAFTWSCYQGAQRPCLTCGTCLERTEAFNLANYPDPALTDVEWQRALTNLRKYTKT
jgi:7-cyano-7-deazaguanine synthase